MKFTANQLALAGQIYFLRNGKDFTFDEIAEITNAVYDLVGLGDPVDLELALEFIGFALKGNPILKDVEATKLIVGKAIYWAPERPPVDIA